MRGTLKPNIFIARSVPPEVEAYLEEHCTCTKWEQEGSIPRDKLLASLHDAEGLLISGGMIDAELLEHAPRLRAVSTISVGYNNFDIEAMKARKVLGTNTPDVLNDTVADLIFGLMLSVARRIPEMDRYVKEGSWKRGDDQALFGLDVHHKKLGIIGMGNIGEAVARRAKFGFQMDIAYHNRSRKPEAESALAAEYLSLPELLQTSDFIVLMTPFTPDTKGLIGSKEFSLMKRTAIFVNASRGATVDEQAMLQALQEGSIFGAGLDVFEREPVSADHPLLRLPNVVTLPHIGSATAQTRLDMAKFAAENLVAALQGRATPGLVKELR